ncbi:hypothetical protein MUA02_18925 [Enterobacteriaceae bacterium H20N1]|uniref:Uncharacterized protein n=1 Tax=Dryocola boscaweniae TaxID=2925397 RepID=A0A9X2WAT9_9ENTR|nr:hypothetical protein [Dryocola boscaweniae]MCT4703930.1 hypothetical protein [Dryocola boscaweniae]MCT4721098.1 hypothetical protein [Dryocola boscaweniae]
MKLIISVLLCSLMLSPCIASSSYADKATETGAKLVDEYTKASSKGKQRFITELQILTHKNPENSNVRKMYANVLLADKQYQSGLQQIEIINKKYGTPSFLLTACMVKERLNMPFNGCYKDIIRIMDKNNVKDVNYLTALFFASDPRFDEERRKQLRADEISGEQAAYYNLSREDFLLNLYPSP